MGIEYLIILTLMCLFFEINCLVVVDGGYSKKSVSKINKAFAILVLLILGILTAFRDVSVGTDTKIYVGIFDSVCDGIYKEEFFRWEIGYQWLNIALAKITDNPQAIIITTSVICYFLIGKYMLKYIDNKLLFVVLFFSLLFSNFTNIIRQAIASSILIFAYEFSNQNKKLKAILLTFLAMAFHTTSVIFLVYIFIKNIKLTEKLTMIVFFSMMGISILAENVLIDLFIKVFPLYEHYFIGERVGTGGLGTTLNLIILAVLFVMYYIPRKNTKIDHQVLWMFLLCASITAMSYVMNNFSRAATILYLPIIKECCMFFPKEKKNTAVEFVGVLALLAIFIIIIIFRPEWNTLYPYGFYSS